MFFVYESHCFFMRNYTCYVVCFHVLADIQPGFCLVVCVLYFIHIHSGWLFFFTVLFFDFYFDFWLVGFDVLFWYLVNWNGSNPILKLSLILVEIMGALPIFLQPSSCFIDA